MKIRRWIPVPLALLAAGCILTSGQFVVDFDLGTVVVPSPTNLVGEFVDLNTIDTYRDHRDKLKTVNDLALLGVLTNNGDAPVAVEVWMTADQTALTTADQVRAAGVRLWGPMPLAPGEPKRIDWDASAALFAPAGKAAVIQEIKGDGDLMLYVLGSGSLYAFTVTEGRFVAVLDAGV